MREHLEFGPGRRKYIHTGLSQGVYTVFVKRINIYIDEALDERAEREARRRHISKAALIRQSLLTELGTKTRDPIDELVGLSEADPADDVDTIIYGA